MTDLNTLVTAANGFSSSFTLISADAINGTGQIVGRALTLDGDFVPFLYDGGVVTNLNSLLPAGSG